MRYSLAILILLLTTSCSNEPHSELKAENTEKIAPTGNKYFDDAQETLKMRRAITPNTSKAKNVILFVADGMGPTTVTAARIFDGQSRGEEGEENLLSFEKFPYLAMSKTYNTNAQTPDSAGTMTAMVTGVKSRAGAISVSHEATVGNCAESKPAFVTTLGELSEQAGLSTGVISTARITHATPAAVYAHASSRNWEADTDLPEDAQTDGCKDIASQLIDFPYGDGIEVVFGGGRQNFLLSEIDSSEPIDEINPKPKGRRRDGRNLADEWTAKSPAHTTVFDNAGFDSIDGSSRPLGLFDWSHMAFEADRSDADDGQPSLTQMTEKAIDILSKNEAGFFLMVEAGRVDHAHHGGNAARALRDAQEFSNAIAAAKKLTTDKETLIVVTADHGHTLTFQGYPTKGNNILGLADTSYPKDLDDLGYGLTGDGKRYTTLSYANGPGSVFVGQDLSDGRPEPSPEEVADLNYRQQALFPSRSESHGGQDVTIYADGPGAYLFGGVVEQNYIFHVIDDALDLRKKAAAAQ